MKRVALGVNAGRLLLKGALTVTLGNPAIMMKMKMIKMMTRFVRSI
jgi:hypothetical protein